MFTMGNDLQVRGIPIDGVGLQMHITCTTPPIRNIVSVIDAVDQRGFKIHISEMDVRVNPQGDLSMLTDERSQLQKKRVNEIVAAFMDLPEENQFAITWWGLRDPESWLIDFWAIRNGACFSIQSINPSRPMRGFLKL